MELRLEPDLGLAVDGAGVDAREMMAAAARLAATIGEAEIVVPGHFVADIAVVDSSQLASGAVRLTIEALTVLS